VNHSSTLPSAARSGSAVAPIHAGAAINPLHASINEAAERLSNIESSLGMTLSSLYNSRPVPLPGNPNAPGMQPSSPGDSLEMKLDRLLHQISVIETQARELART
jgi:hypothetical protein